VSTLTSYISLDKPTLNLDHEIEKILTRHKWLYK
jgi:hypothetical protein